MNKMTNFSQEKGTICTKQRGFIVGFEALSQAVGDLTMGMESCLRHWGFSLRFGVMT